MKIRAKLQFPFLQTDLMTVSKFVSHCQEYGIKTDKEELEYYDRINLLIPPARILMGVTEYRRIKAKFNDILEWRYVYSEDVKKHNPIKIDSKTYYTRGALDMSYPGFQGKLRGFHYGQSGWMDWYEKRGMVQYPANEDYLEWSRFKDGPDFSTNYSLHENASEIMYSKFQIYPLTHIQKALRFTIKNEALTAEPKSWLKMGEDVRKIYADNKSLQTGLVKFNDFFSFHRQIRLMLLERNAKISERYKEALNNPDIKDPHSYAEAEAIAEAEFLNETLWGEADSMLAKSDLTLQDLYDWRQKMMNFGIFQYGTFARRLRPLIASIPNEVLEKGDQTYGIINQVSWFIDKVESNRPERNRRGKTQNAKQLLMLETQITCPYCQRSFEPRNSTQKSCGRQKCKDQHRNWMKKEKRKREAARYRTKSLA